MRTSPIVLNPSLLDVARRRRSAGESLKAMAVEFGVTWQKLEKAIRNGLRGKADPIPSARTKTALKATQAASPVLLESRVKADQDGRSLALTEKYRPRTLAGLWGQPKVVVALQRFAKAPCSAAFLFEGGTGTGKTSAALALARELGCDVDASEYGGVWEIASGEQSADAVRETGRRMWVHPWQGSGWKVVIVNEADRMCRPAEVVWLDLLEHLPRKTVVVFTTNDAGRLAARFCDRCTRLFFRSDAAFMATPTRDFLLAVWQAETGKKPDLGKVERMVLDSVQDGQVSVRRALQMLGAALLERDGGAS
ncbi:MAG: AAA family ATPase [Planctomycetes bacterium]|nr:AAA family ATPase [Planctomycetota bacterium]